ncbi:MAG TPA: zinc-ribbon domain-containing protein [Ktedonobacterales bacterium]|nr:zinc-ribbon domain-containing protein [Ktedonobacterales bacterium]
MTTCEHCGADAVGADGLCRACGWRAGGVAALSVDDMPSLAETREADVPTPVRSSLLAPPRPATSGPRSGYADQPTVGPSARATGAELGMGPSSRFCGTCGARIEAGKQFCGQCGSPILPSAGLDDGTALQRSVYPSGVRGAADSWGAADQDAPTEEFGQFGLGGYPQQFGASGYYARSGVSPAAQRSDTRILIGIFCVLGGLLSAAAALILAIAPR